MLSASSRAFSAATCTAKSPFEPVPLVAAAASAAASAPWWNPALETASTVLQPVSAHALTRLSTPGDVQGALVLLPVYQFALLTGLWTALSGRRDAARYAAALGSLCVVQLLTLAAFGEFEAHAGMHLHALVVRSCAVAVPVLLALAFMRRGADEAPDASAYRDFWHDVGDHFPSLTGARSTAYYFDNEARLLREQIPDMRGCALLKTDLWDEAKNTRILQWAADQGARVFGIDISGPIAAQARRAFEGRRLNASLADVRLLPFTDASFDAIYSMGTIEHFPESAEAVRELARVLKPGGRLVLGEIGRAHV